jgi:hypothetical protein
MLRALLACALAVLVVAPRPANGQGLTGALIVTVRDQQGQTIAGARVTLSSPALIGGPLSQPTNEKGQVRFPVLPPGDYALDIEFKGFTPRHEDGINIGPGATLERPAILSLAGVSESVIVEAGGSRIEARSSGVETRFQPELLGTIPTRRFSMVDFLRAAPGMSPTSTANGTNNAISSFGSSTNENTFLVDGTNFTCPCSGLARSEPGVDFIQEIQIQSVGISAEYGNMQGAVINVVTRQGSNRFLADASYFGQTARLTAEPVRLPCRNCSLPETGYVRDAYHDVTANLGGPIVRDRVWFFTGYQFVRDYDSQPGTDPLWPRTAQQNKVFGKVTSQLTPVWRLAQSFHGEYWVNPDRPTIIRPIEATQRRQASVPAMTFADVTHVASATTVWNVRAGRFVYDEDDDLGSGDPTIAPRVNLATGEASGNPPAFGGLWIARTTIKATIDQYRPGWLGADHALKMGAQFERGEHNAVTIIPTGVRYEDARTGPFQSVSRAPSSAGGLSETWSAFVSDAITLRDRLTINAGLRFDRVEAVSQDVPGVDANAEETGAIVAGRGTLYTWNLLSPRLGVTAKLSADGRTMLRASYGRFYQGVLTAELTTLHPGWTPTTRMTFSPLTGDYTILDSVDDAAINVQLDSGIRSPRTDEYSIGVDREILPRLSAAIAYIHKEGSHYIGWTEIAGIYREETRTPVEGYTVPVFVLTNEKADRRFLLTNPQGYELAYNGVVAVVEKRRSHGWQALGSYTWSRTSGLQPSSGTTAGGTQISNLLPTGTFGQDPNDLTNARGRLPNDRPHMFRLMGAVDVPGGFVVAGHLQYLTGKPWAMSARIPLPQNVAGQRVLLEPRGSRRLTSPTLLDLRVSRRIPCGRVGDIALTLDVLNLLNSTAEEELASDDRTNTNFGKASVFTDPRRAMFSIRLNLGR